MALAAGDRAVTAARRIAEHMASWPAWVLLFFICGYQLLLSPLLGPSCRFQPNCSQYALAAMRAHGACVGVAWVVRRPVCGQPWHSGGMDPVSPLDARFSFWRKR
ncbi:membrane protein insertion efficiency factor YidD [Variovorax sp. GB1P17]|uniref:membrane protein insertion efficiency factor YidD n=1 Tax=Variovorax sp. GB1P17 TaxID=3443740 RepID=UPI003F468370